MFRTGTINLAALVALWAVAPAPAQQRAPDLEPVDQTIEDVSALSMSLRRIEPGLQRPNDLARVYRIDGTEDLYVRQQGGLYAVFPQSVYAVTREGQLVAPIPHGTVFYIGAPPLPAAEPPPAPPFDARIQGRVQETDPFAGGQDYSTTRGRPRVAKSGLSPTRLPAIVRDEAYRHRRVHDLMRRAAASRKGRDGQS